MKKIAGLLLFLLPAAALFPFGKKEEEKKPFNETWVLCVTEFDVSAIPIPNQITGQLLARDLTEVLKGIIKRYRSGDEKDWYRGYALSRALNTAAKALAAKREERALLVFKGERNWKYRKSLAAIDTEIQKLEESYRAVESGLAPVEGEPVFKLSEDNIKGVYPKAPVFPGEYRFLMNQKADAFITGAVSEYHGRLYMRVKMYTRYTGSYSYEDFIVFSTSDSAAAIEELASRMVEAASETPPAFVTVRANPDNAVILVNGAFAGQGEVTEREQAPGLTDVQIFTDDYYSETVPLALRGGEISELYLNLTPLAFSSFTLDTPENPGSAVYRGALFLGNTPLTLNLPRDRYEYISVESLSGDTASAVLMGDRVVKSVFQTAKADTEGTLNLSVRPPLLEDKPVEKSRRRFYSAYGRLWIALPVAFLLNGVYSAYNVSNAGYPSQGMAGNVTLYNWATIAGWAAVGAAGVELVYRIYRYLRNSSADVSPLDGTLGKKPMENPGAEESLTETPAELSGAEAEPGEPEEK
jgi:hypothetical protein